MMFSSIKDQIQKVAFRLFLLVFCMANLYVFSLYAQNKRSNVIIFDNCEGMLVRLETVMNDFVKNAKPDSYLIIIGGAMKGEKPSSNNRRIHQAIGYINYGAITKNKRIVSGIGTPETKAGYLRFYVNGMLSAEIRTRKNGKLCGGDGQPLIF